MEDRGKTEGTTAELTSKQREANVQGKLKKREEEEALCARVQMSA